jgi:hypothetical protein
MDREALVTELRALRGEIARLVGDPSSPALERSLSLADMYLHLALWHLGEVVELTPEQGIFEAPVQNAPPQPYLGQDTKRH